MQKYKYVKIQRKIFSEDDLATICIDFGLLHSLYCKISYLLAEEHWSHTNLGIWQPTYDSVCKDNSWIHGKCRQRLLSNVYKRFFLYFLHVFNVFYFHLNVYYIYRFLRVTCNQWATPVASQLHHLRVRHSVQVVCRNDEPRQPDFYISAEICGYSQL